MAEQSNVKSAVYTDEEGIEWQECISAKGVTYRVGSKPGEDSKQDDLPVDGKKDFGINVDWEVDTANYLPTDFVNKTGISYYCLNKGGSGAYTYRITFTNHEHYNYHFIDRTGDSYQCNTYINRTHYVDYNSADAAIITVTGS
jgi:hypothetical protein